MPTRILRDGILTSERVARLGWSEEVFYRRLMSVVDDHGRYYALPALLRAACYPLHLDKVSDADIGKWLTVCVTAGLVSVYPASDGKRYLEILDFNQRVQSKSKFPASDGCPRVDNGDSRCSTVDHGEPRKVTALDGVEDEVVDEDEIPPVVPHPGDKLVAIVIDAYHEALPRCRRAEAITPKRKRRIHHADKLAKGLCQRQGWAYDQLEFWQAYFGECSQDPWLRGDVPNPKNPAWRQNLDVLLAEDRFASIMDTAITAMRAQA